MVAVFRWLPQGCVGVAEPRRSDDRAIAIQPPAVQTSKTGFGHQRFGRIELFDPDATTFARSNNLRRGSFGPAPNCAELPAIRHVARPSADARFVRSMFASKKLQGRAGQGGEGCKTGGNSVEDLLKDHGIKTKAEISDQAADLPLPAGAERRVILTASVKCIILLIQ